MVKNAGSKNKRGRLMKNMKSPNSGLTIDSRDIFVPGIGFNVQDSLHLPRLDFC